MSDCFDHMVDAFEDYEARGCDDDAGDGSWFLSRRGRRGRRSHRSSTFVRDPLYYHTKLEFERIVHRTDKAILFEFKRFGEQWVPEKLCRKLDEEECSVFVYTPFIRSITLRGTP